MVQKVDFFISLIFFFDSGPLESAKSRSSFSAVHKHRYKKNKDFLHKNPCNGINYIMNTFYHGSKYEKSLET